MNDIVRAVRGFAIKSHELNKDIGNDTVLVKMKPNPENDNYFYDDEEKDWYEAGWDSLSCSLGKAQLVRYKDDLKDNELLEDFKEEDLQKRIDFIPSSIRKPYLHMVLEEENALSHELIRTISDLQHYVRFTSNLRNFLRVLGITNFP